MELVEQNDDGGGATVMPPCRASHLAVFRPWEHGTSAFPSCSGPRGSSDLNSDDLKWQGQFQPSLSTFYVWDFYFFFNLYFSYPVYLDIYVFIISCLKSLERGHIGTIIKITVAADIL